ncbi:MAG: hypothetical protein KatS3mg087_0122 [Patescibacteria group bacterium]|nr:MAG: hypothetical protein KatS3mg087_0122 [Patescibacteria group bacterium]
MALNDENQYYNELWLSDILSGHIKTAQESADAFLRIRVREDGVLRRVIEPIAVTRDDFTPQVDTDQPVIVVEKEPQSPGAMTIPFGDNNPPAYYIQGSRFRVVLQLLTSRTLRKAVHELATWRADIKQLLAEMLVKDLTWNEDANFINACNTLLGGSAGATNVISGLTQWHTMPGGITRTSVGDAFKLAFIPPSRIPITTILCNVATTAELFKWERNELGGDDAQSVLYEGWADRKINNAKVVTTIKRELIPDDTMFFFGHPMFIGKFYVWQEPSLYIEKVDTEIKFRAHEVVGLAIGHGDGVHRFDFTT